MSMIINQNELFGQTQKAFNLATLKGLSDQDAHNDTTFTSTKKYFLQYFAKSLSDVFYEYQPQEDEEGHILNREHLNGVWCSINKYYEFIDPLTGKSDKFSLKNWFMVEHFQTYRINSDPRCARFYTNPKTEQCFINLSKGFLHKNIKSFESYSPHIKSQVQTIINHILNVWNSGDEEAGEFCLNFLAHALTGHKMNVALFLKSGEGTGKSIILDFIIRYVIGEDLGLSTARAQQLMKFNSQLMGKILVCLEELPTASKSEWHSVSDYLKDLITGSKMDIEKKFADCVQTVNLISLIILTNNENTIKFGKDARRYFMCDVSHDKVGNTSYFMNLVNACNNKEVGEAFFMFLLERYEATKDFNPSECPMTNAKLEMKQHNISPVLEYIKKEYVAKRQGLMDSSIKHGMIKYNDLKDKINQTYQLNMNTYNFTIALNKDIPIVKIVKYGAANVKHIAQIKEKDLMAFYKKKGFWSDDNDEFYNGNKKVVKLPDAFNDLKDIVDIESENIKLRTENNDLRAELKKANKLLKRKSSEKVILDYEIIQNTTELLESMKEYLKINKPIKIKQVKPKPLTAFDLFGDDFDEESFMNLLDQC